MLVVDIFESGYATVRLLLYYLINLMTINWTHYYAGQF